MPSPSDAIRAWALASAAILACGTPSGGEKGSLVPVAIPRARLEAAHAPKRLALVVGIQSFDDPEWRPLRYPQADAAAVAAVLRDPALGAFDDVEVLAGGPTRDELRSALARLADRSRDERDTVLVYVSSHGTLARDSAGRLRRYLVARDSRLRAVADTALGMEELERGFDGIRSRRKVLLLATCHSGSGKSLLPQDVRAELAGTKGGFFVRPIEEVSKATMVLAASDWGETAREDEALGGDIYTHFFVEALRAGADRNGDGAVTASEAHDHARRMTYEYTRGRQRPSAETSEVGADAVVLVGKLVRAGRPELYGYAPALDGFTVRVDGRPLGDLPGGIAVDPGRHRIQIAKGAGPELADEWIRLGEGERIDVARLVARGAGRWEAAPRLGVLSFLGSRDRREVMGTVPSAGAALSCSDWPAPGMSLRLDATGAAGRSRLVLVDHEAPFRYSAVIAGVALPWRIAVKGPGGPSVLAGPRLSALWLDRRFDLALARAGQSYFTLVPGLLAGASVPVGRGVTVGGELHLDFAVVRVDGRSRSSGLGELLLGAGYRF